MPERNLFKEMEELLADVRRVESKTIDTLPAANELDDPSLHEYKREIGAVVADLKSHLDKIENACLV